MIIEGSKNENKVHLVLNYLCNNKCLMCGVPHKKHNLYNENLNFFIEEMKKIDFTVDTFIVSGGEPLLFGEFEKLIFFIKETFKCKVELLTNGRLLKNTLVMNKIKKMKLDKITIPFFHYDEKVYDELSGAEGSYKDVLSGLNHLDKSDIEYVLKFIPHKQNYADIYETYKFCESNFQRFKFDICGCQVFGEAEVNQNSIGVRYKNVGVELEAFLSKVSSERSTKFNIYRFPMCCIDPIYWDHIVVTLFKEHLIAPDFSNVNTSSVNRKKTEPISECVGCYNHLNCDWYSPKYIELYGEGELNKIIIKK